MAGRNINRSRCFLQEYSNIRETQPMPQQRLNCKTGLKFKLTIGGDDVRVERGGGTQVGVMSGKKKTRGTGLGQRRRGGAGVDGKQTVEENKKHAKTTQI